MKQIDNRAGYRVPDGYFEDFSTRMAVMARQTPRRRFSMRRLLVPVASVAAAVAIAFGIFSKDSSDFILSVPSEVIITKYFGATESEVVNYYYLPEEDEQNSLSDEDILDYLSNSGSVNLYALMDLQTL